MGARVFVSCGQDSPAERKIAEEISNLLESKNYEPYVAINDHSLRGLKENIFNRLRESEYFLLVDFKRESISGTEFRGSLFCHQELALAAFLQKKVLAFHQEGIRREGILGIVQANSLPFSDTASLVRSLEKEITLNWNSNWRDELILTRIPKQSVREVHGRGDVQYFHLEAQNNHYRDTAFGCCCFLEQLIDVSSKYKIQVPRVEFKWRGAHLPAVVIPYASSREVDAFLMYHNDPRKLYSCALTDSHRHQTQILQPGQYEATFALYSQNFECVRQTFFLSFDGSGFESVVFEPISKLL